MPKISCHATLLCLRRGPLEDPWNQRVLGHSDPPLAGGQGSREISVIHRMAAYAPLKILASDLVRARMTAEALARESGADLVVSSALREQLLGVWQGRPWSEVIAQDPRAAAFLGNFSEARPPDGETLGEVQDRVVPVLRRLCRRHPRQVLCYVGHAGPIRCLVADALELPLRVMARFQIDPFGLTVIRYQGAFATLALLNHPVGGEHPADVIY